MRLSEFRDAWKAIPFRPFTMLSADGNRYHVPHPDFFMVPPKGDRTLIFVRDDGSTVLLDPLLITAIEFDPAPDAESDPRSGAA